MTNPAAWHPDPTSAHEYRWWDGTRWTEHVADGGQASVDPLAGDPGTASSDTGRGGDAEAGSSAYGDGGERSVDDGAATGAAPGYQPEAGDPETTAEQPVQPSQRSWEQPEQSWQQPTGQGAAGAGGPPPAWQQAPAWQQSGGDPSAPSGTNGIAIAAMVIGIIALLISWLPIVGVLAGVLALVLGFVGRSKAKKTPAIGGNGPAITGIVTGILATLISIAVTIALFAFGSTFMGSFETYEDCIQQGGTAEECEQELERDILDRFGQ